MESQHVKVETSESISDEVRGDIEKVLMAVDGVIDQFKLSREQVSLGGDDGSLSQNETSCDGDVMK